MKKEELQKQVIRLGREVTEWLAEMTESDVQQLEGKLDQLVSKLQKDYGWTSTRAKRELAAYLDQYSGRTQDLVDQTLDRLNARFHSRGKRKSSPWGKLLWVGFGVGVAAVAWKMIPPQNDSL
jgi:uncharacterized protein YjbJ (UPF0337 family)